MSNFTDFNIFETQSDVSLRYVDFGESIGNPDMLIIPGTKSTVDDLKYLREELDLRAGKRNVLEEESWYLESVVDTRC